VDFKMAVCHKPEQSFLHWKTGIARQFFVKWWDKFDFSRVQSRLHHEYPLKKEALQMIQTIMAQSQQPPEPITEQASKEKGLLRRISRLLPLPLLSSFMSKMKKIQMKNLL
jgi:hypothetical protein